ncbi:MAG: hypothetical protein E5Y88_12395 [Mesorhizobium sp.]|uniref:hypothetical protein n=1 Tax=Mesorhizobium sp. TaxID=1871066 RepID=UPI001211E15A|nr:hypothetical protein [Mesorhizobium sp.]TIL25740.1 MAG: hypothetical protein E5Y88_12395 [Mesorhizobium sp.]
MRPDWLKNLKLERSRLFWFRHKQGLLPFDTNDYVLLANAMLRAGAAMFGDAWHWDILRRAHLPMLLPQEPRWVGGVNSDYALELVMTYRPDALSMDPREPRHKYQNPLTSGEWTAAEEIYETHERKRNFAAIKMAHEVRRAMTRALTDGVLISATRSNGRYQEILAEHWNDEARTAWRFIESQMYLADPWQENWPTALEELTHVEMPPAIVPGNAWIFVTEASLDHFNAVSADDAPRVVHPLPAENSGIIAVEVLSEPPTSSPRKRNRRPQDQDLVKPFLAALWGNGIPDRSELKDAELVKAVGDAMQTAWEKNKTVPGKIRTVPSKETILRAAGRK